MTLDSTTSKVQYTQSGTTTAWPVPYKFLDNEDLIVITTVDDVDTTLVLDTDYTVNGAGDDAGGTVTISPAVATGTRVTIYREIDIDQPTELTTAGGWFPKVHEAVFDRLTMIDQQLQEQLDRSVKLAPSTTLDPGTVAEELFEARDDAQMAAAAAEDSASAAQGYAGTAASFMDAAGLSESNAAGSEAAAAISAGAAYVDATKAESARDTAILKAAEAAASAAIAVEALNADAWSASVNYVVGDVVYTTTGKSYRCIDPNINNNPDTDDGSDWFLLSLALGEASNTAYRGDRGKTAYDHSQVAHAPSDAQKNSDITKAEIEAKLTGTITSHSHGATGLPLTGGTLTGNLDISNTSPTINFADTDNITRSIHCNSNLIGFLSSSFGWTFQSNNDGTNTSIGNMFVGSATYATDGNIYMPWAGDWLSNVLSYKVTKDVGVFGVGTFALVRHMSRDVDIVAGGTYSGASLGAMYNTTSDTGAISWGAVTLPGTWRAMVAVNTGTYTYAVFPAQRIA